MKKHTLLCLLASAVLASCGTPPTNKPDDFQVWVQGAKAQAKAGETKWSDYYKGLYQRLKNENYVDRIHLMEITSNMIDVALLFEDGKIDKNSFDSFQRQAEISAEKNAGQLDRAQSERQRAAWAASMQSLSNTFKQQQQHHQNQLKSRQTCTTSWTGNAWESVCR